MSSTIKVPFLDLTRVHQSIASELHESFNRILLKSTFILGEEVDIFEKAWAESLGVDHCVGCSNGTDAIYLALRALGVGEGDEVITVSHTYIATVQAIVAAGAKPVLVDVCARDGLMDVSLLEDKITSRTKCILPVHLYGQTVDMDPLLKICGRLKLFCVEDAAQAHGAKYKGRCAGSLGDIGTFSFYPGKNLGALGDAGAVVTNDDALAERIKSLRNHGRSNHFTHNEFSGNMRIDAVQAAWLRVKLAYLPIWVEQRRNIAEIYQKRLSSHPAIGLFSDYPERFHSFHQFVIQLPNRDELKQKLKDKGVETGLHYPVASHQQQAWLSRFPMASLPQTEKIARDCLSLPIFPGLRSDEIDYVVESIFDCLE